MRKTIGIFAHVDAGKTTLSQQILLQTGALRAGGGRALYLDDAPLEQQRGITIFSSAAPFSHGGEEYTLIDTPGHLDFGAEAERCVSVLDCAVLLVSATDGIQGHTEALWRLLARYRVPTVLFLNKTDRPTADPDGVLAALRQRFSADCILFDGSLFSPAPPEAAFEAVAEREDALLEAYLAGEATPQQLLSSAAALCGSRRLFPVFAGSALTGEGVEPLLCGLDRLLATDYEKRETAPFAARIWQIRHDKQGVRLSFLKVLSGRLSVKASIGADKVNELRRYTGPRFEPVQCLDAGEVGAAAGLSLPAGSLIGAEGEVASPLFTPVLTAKVVMNPAQEPAVRRAFALLTEEDPALQAHWDEGTRTLEIRVMGRVQLEVLTALLCERFGLEVRFDRPAVRYLETITAPVVGIGHFEPLRHYAEVWLQLSPGPRGSGIRFESACSTDLLDQNFQNLIRTHVLEKEHRGVLTGAPVTDLTVTLLTGRSHLKHTEGGDFRQAVYRAIRQGLATAAAAGNCLLLEPCYDFTVTAPAAAAGRIMADIQKRQGSFDPPQSEGETAVIEGRGPAAQFLDYAAELPAFTGGLGSFFASFGGYEPCRDAAQIIAGAGYEFERDTENPADSIFCSHGAGHPVRWDEVPAHAHCSL
ncbi:MAG TPA: TetM/TetW/TetO/TetS family tetracycline resistance ribosomal protection protein [Candidatus Pygmaiobacter gallistercoris]|nr:TetM/TetW/TetO/TetS family tetracycline resistance ribosomal protection protein [Candidatus Pygmaiobacter gallistercoris]